MTQYNSELGIGDMIYAYCGEYEKERELTIAQVSFEELNHIPAISYWCVPYLDNPRVGVRVYDYELNNDIFFTSREEMGRKHVLYRV